MNKRIEDRIAYTAIVELYLKPLVQQDIISYETYYNAGNLLFEQLEMQHFQNAYRPVKKMNAQTAQTKKQPKEQHPDFVSLTKLARHYKQGTPNQVITGWLNRKDTKAFIELWQQQSKNSTGLMTQRGHQGGTYATPAIAYYFMLCMSPDFALQLIKQAIETGVALHE